MAELIVRGGTHFDDNGSSLDNIAFGIAMGSIFVIAVSVVCLVKYRRKCCCWRSTAVGNPPAVNMRHVNGAIPRLAENAV